MHTCHFSHVWLFVTPWTVACQAPLSTGFSRQEYWSGLPFRSPGDLPKAGIKPKSPTLAGIFFTTEPPGKPYNLAILDACMHLGDIYKKFHSSIVDNSKQLKTTHRSMNSGMDTFYYGHKMKYYSALKNELHLSTSTWMNLKSQAKKLQKNSYSMILFIKVQKQIILTTYYFYYVNVIAQSCPTLCNPIEYSLPVSSAEGIFQARILERVAIPFFRGSFQPRDHTRISCQVSCIGRQILYHWATWEALRYTINYY